MAQTPITSVSNVDTDKEFDDSIPPVNVILQTIEVQPNAKHSTRYTRKNNTAVELIRNVIAHKDSNHINRSTAYKVDTYEKLALALERDTFNFQRNKFWQKFAFLENYIDTSTLSGKNTLLFSFHEYENELYYRRKPRAHKKKIIAEQCKGVEATIRQYNISQNLEQLLRPVDIYDNTISLLSNKFISPISATAGNAFYQYYIIDTVMIDNLKCIDLRFVPVNEESFGFTGHLYIVLNGTYAIKRVQLNVPQQINLNFVSNLTIQQDFDSLPNGRWGLCRTDTYVNFFILHKKGTVYAHQTQTYQNYDFTLTGNEPIFSELGEINKTDTIRYSISEWAEHRQVALTPQETQLDCLMLHIDSVPEFYTLIRTAETLSDGYITTEKHSKFDIGQIWSFVSWNKLEGARFRLGGTTTGYLHPHWFLAGYVAVGTRDWNYYTQHNGAKSGAAHGIKYGLKLTYSFNENKYHPYEAWRNLITLSTEYDTYEPGKQNTLFEKDNIFMNIPFAKPDYTYMPYYYKRSTELRYEKEWANHIRLTTYALHEINEAAGTLQYLRYDAQANTTNIVKFSNIELGVELRYAPTEPIYNNRTGKESPFHVTKDAPVIKLGYRIGVLDYNPKFIYNITDFSLDYRLWMAAFGHIDITFQAGIQWNKVPFPKLFLPNANQSIVLQPKAFNLMKPMEFICDQYMALNLTYYMKGLIFNHIPGLNRLQWREVVSFNCLYGRLTDKNNPNPLNPTDDFTQEGLYELPAAVNPMGTGSIYRDTNNKIPYMEMTVGIENILKFIRIDYVRRLTYIGGLGTWERNGIRVSFRFTI